MRDTGRDLRELSQADHARLAGALMKRQGALSLRVGAVFVALVFGLPLVNQYAPDFANRSAFGFSLTWLFLGAFFFPITWALSAYFVKESNRIESDLGDWKTNPPRERPTVEQSAGKTGRAGAVNSPTPREGGGRQPRKRMRGAR